jgi:hypothetical protein
MKVMNHPPIWVGMNFESGNGAKPGSCGAD